MYHLVDQFPGDQYFHVNASTGQITLSGDFKLDPDNSTVYFVRKSSVMAFFCIC